MSAAAVLKPKEYPLNYPADVLAVVDALAFNAKNVTIAGSMSLRSQQYAGDYDLFEEVVLPGKSRAAALSAAARGLQENIRQLLALPECYVGDIKCGEIAAWRIITGDVRGGRVVGWNHAEAMKRMAVLVEEGIITEAEAKEAHSHMHDHPTPAQFLQMEKEIRPQIVRWSVKDVLRGYTVLRTGARFTLEDGIQTPAVTKIDAIAMVENSRFTDFSCIYAFRWNRTTLNDFLNHPEHEIRKNILYLDAEGSYFKLGKRLFSLLKTLPRRRKDLEALSEVFNGDLGRLYSIISDIGTILFLLENESVVPLKKIRYEVGQFRARMGNIFETDRVNTPRVLSDLLSLETSSRATLQRGLESLATKLTGVLNAEAERELRRLRLLPVEKAFLP